MSIKTYSTLSQAVNGLKDRGFTHNFEYKEGQLHCVNNGKNFKPDELEIVEYHRFEGESNPSDMSIVFAVKGQDGLKGTVVSSYGAYANMKLVDFMDKVKIANRSEVAGDKK